MRIERVALSFGRWSHLVSGISADFLIFVKKVRDSRKAFLPASHRGCVPNELLAKLYSLALHDDVVPLPMRSCLRSSLIGLVGQSPRTQNSWKPIHGAD